MPAEYLTPAALQQRLGERLAQILDVPADADVSANAVLLAAVADANQQVESYVLPQYPEGLTTPGQLASHAAAIAVVKLLEGRRRDLLMQGDVDLYDRTMAFLRDVATGKARLQPAGETQQDYETVPTQVELGGGTRNADAGEYFGQRNRWFGSF